jgi:murein DD-endopeptidase
MHPTTMLFVLQKIVWGDVTMGCPRAAGRTMIPLSFLVLVSLLGAGCASAPPSGSGRYSQSVGDRAADTALTMLDRPYEYRGETPKGFDCSGLVRYSYLRAGMDVPHGTRALLKRTRSVGRGEARKGDLVFFVQSGKKYSHVGIYLGSGKFVHAPSTGGRVRLDSLDDPYWKKHYLDTRRFL